ARGGRGGGGAELAVSIGGGACGHEVLAGAFTGRRAHQVDVVAAGDEGARVNRALRVFHGSDELLVEGIDRPGLDEVGNLAARAERLVETHHSAGRQRAARPGGDVSTVG